MKKLLILFVLTFLCIAVFTACKNSESDTTKGADNTQTSSDSSISADPSDTTVPDSSGTAQISEVPVSSGAEQTSETPESTGTPDTTPVVPVCSTHKPDEKGLYCTECGQIIKKDWGEYSEMIYFECDNKVLSDAYKIAITDSMDNVKAFKDGLLTKYANCIIAGRDYTTPWTRDTAINVWNAFALMDAQISKNTLLSVLEKRSDGKVYIAGQYWDAIIWTIGAYKYIEITGDTEFLPTACEAVKNSLKFFEETEYDSAKGLFRGAAVYGDGVAAYPDKYTNPYSPGITDWTKMPENKNLLASTGEGLPMCVLSTNCVYYESYVLCAKMCEMLKQDGSSYLTKAEALKKAINDKFWNEAKGTYDYIAGECDYQEGMGLAFTVMFGIADERRAALVLENIEITPNGIACVWPSFDRYLELGGYGRHSGTIWPHIQGYWAQAAFMLNDTYGFENEMFLMAEKAVANNQFHEIYHPMTGAVYGGIQEFENYNIGQWGSCAHQTWSATAYLSLIYYDVIGADITAGSVTFKPYLPTGVNEAVLKGMKIGNSTFDVIVTRGSQHPGTATFDTTKQGTFTVYLSVE